MGLVQVLENLGRLRDALDLKLSLLAVVPTRFDLRLRIAREVVNAIRDIAPEALTDVSIREAVALRELSGHRVPIRSYRPESTGAVDYALLAEEVLRRASIPQEV